MDRNPLWLSGSWTLIFVFGFSVLCSFCCWVSVLHVCLSLYLWIWSVVSRFPTKFCLSNYELRIIVTAGLASSQNQLAINSFFRIRNRNQPDFIPWRKTVLQVKGLLRSHYNFSWWTDFNGIGIVWTKVATNT